MSKRMERNARTYLIRGTLAVALLLIALYTLFELRHLIVGPIIVLSYPQNGATVTEPLIEIRGNTRNVAHITLNDRQIFVDSKGNLRESLLLATGYNVLRIKGRDRLGRDTERLLEVMLNDYTSTTTAATDLSPSF